MLSLLNSLLRSRLLFIKFEADLGDFAGCRGNVSKGCCYFEVLYDFFLWYRYVRTRDPLSL
jgi:hypothetical protein